MDSTQRIKVIGVTIVIVIAAFEYGSYTGEENPVAVDDDEDVRPGDAISADPPTVGPGSRGQSSSFSHARDEGVPLESVRRAQGQRANTPESPSGENNAESISRSTMREEDIAKPNFERDVPSDLEGQEDGHSSERFAKVDVSGGELPQAAENWNCVVDSSTGLVWEVKSAEGGLHYNGNKVSWYYPELSHSGVFPGRPSPEDGTCGHSESENDPKTGGSAPCNTRDFEANVNQKLLCGYSDWRVPSAIELESLVDSERKAPAIDTNYFPGTQNGYYWTTSSYAYDDRSSWAISFVGGVKNDQEKKLGRYIRLVRGSWDNE